MGGFSSFGTLLKKGDGAEPEVFATVAEVGDIDGPGFDSESHDVTSHSSAGSFREKVAGLLDAGEISFPIFFKPADATHDASTGLIADYLARSNKNWKLEWPVSPVESVSFPGRVKALSFGAPVDGALTADVTIEVTGAPTFS